MAKESRNLLFVREDITSKLVSIENYPVEAISFR